MGEKFSTLLRDKRFILIGFCLIIVLVFVVSNANRPNPPDHGPGGAQESEIVSILPVTNVKGPYTIEYIETINGVDHIKITDSSPSGREAALDWLRAHDIDIGKLNIVFDEYNNPFTEVPVNE